MAVKPKHLARGVVDYPVHRSRALRGSNGGLHLRLEQCILVLKRGRLKVMKLRAKLTTQLWDTHKKMTPTLSLPKGTEVIVVGPAKGPVHRAGLFTVKIGDDEHLAFAPEFERC